MPTAATAEKAVTEKSGVLRLRLPVSLHSELADLADRERVSLNYLIGALLAAGAAEWARRALVRNGKEVATANN